MNIQGIIQEVATTPEEHLSCNFLFFFFSSFKTANHYQEYIFFN